ncbi:MAG TPA: NADH-quinone oxidoreductase subunit M [Baekduia sp.]|nr:NADH-quinone oxidoreductase subunit M [Baekduia sp.]
MTIHLSILIALPLAGALFGRYSAITGSVLALAYAIAAVADFDSGASGLQYVTDETWIAQLGIHYKVGLDGLNLILVLLTTVLFTASVFWIIREKVERERLYLGLMGAAHSGVLLALTAQDLALFVIAFDLMLVPFLFITGIWGPVATRAAAITKLFIYTLVGSLLMLAAAIGLAVLVKNQSGAEHLSFAFSDLAKVRLPSSTQNWIFLGFAAAFLVKMPAFPFHGWMPDGYRNMPLPALAVFSAILSKVAAYGFLRVVAPLLPDAMAHFQLLLLLIALASVLYGSAMAFSTTEARLVLGYSSVAQLGFIVLGVFAIQDAGAQGAILQAVNHGLVVAPAFFIVSLLAKRAGGSEDIRDMGGLALRAPILAGLFLIVAFANLAMPGSSNFVGEFMILLGLFQAEPAIAIIASIGVVMAAVYSLRLFIRAMHNRVGPDAESREIGLTNALILVPLVGIILVLAFYPQLPLKKGEKAVTGSIAAAKESAR